MVPTLNISRIASEGLLFTDQYAQPTWTPGRAAFITCQLPIRIGMTTVGMPDSPIGLDRRDPSQAKLLKSRGYATGRFGKNHLGDRNSHLPTVHRFDEFYGNLSHLNTEQEPELGDWPLNAALNQRYRPRGVLYGQASKRDDPTVDPRFGRVARLVSCTPARPGAPALASDSALRFHRIRNGSKRCSGAWLDQSLWRRPA